MDRRSRTFCFSREDVCECFVPSFLFNFLRIRGGYLKFSIPAGAGAVLRFLFAIRELQHCNTLESSVVTRGVRRVRCDTCCMPDRRCCHRAGRRPGRVSVRKSVMAKVSPVVALRERGSNEKYAAVQLALTNACNISRAYFHDMSFISTDLPKSRSRLQRQFANVGLGRVRGEFSSRLSGRMRRVLLF